MGAFRFDTCTGLSLKLAALEVSPHALTHALNFESCCMVTQCMKTVKASQEYCPQAKAILPEAEEIDHPIEWRERKREKKRGWEGRTGSYMLPWPLRLGFV